jgi:hypothetical protein
MSGWIAKKGRGFLPADDETARVHVRMKDGECAQVKIIRPRSVPWNRMYFGICEDIGKNQEPAVTKDVIDHKVRIYAGHRETIFIDGRECVWAKRIAFDQLTADEWADLWPSLELAIREHYGDEYIGEQRMAG